MSSMAAHDRARIGVQVLVDRGAHHDHHVLDRRHDRRVGAQGQPPVGEDPGQDLVGAPLDERHLPGPDAVDRDLVDVVEHDVEPGVGEGQAEGEPDVPAPTDHRQGTMSFHAGRPPSPG